MEKIKEYICIGPLGNVLEIKGLKEFCRKYGLDIDKIMNIMQVDKIVKNYNGWRIYELTI